jgi:uncharacterized protein (TIGR02594 family)
VKLPKEYEWLNAEPTPRMLIEALKEYGVKEHPGDEDNPVIIGWAKETGLDRTYRDDLTPWCGLFMAVVAKRAGKSVPATPLWARSWANWGSATPLAMLGDVLVFTRRGGGGHVGIYVGEDSSCYHVLGGNQQDMVCIVRLLKSRCIAVRRQYKTAVPSNVRRIYLEASGAISVDER